jgi:hypothetical protein
MNWWNISFIVVAMVSTISLQIPQLNRRISGQTPEGDRQWVIQESARLSVLQRLPPRGFGFNNLISTYTFLGFLQYFGDDVARIAHGTGYGLTPAYFQVIVPRDPRFIQSYLYLSVGVSMFTAQPRKAIALYEKGTAVIDPAKQRYGYTVWMRQATDQLLFMGDSQGARQSYLKAAEWASIPQFKPDDLPETQIIPNSNPPTNYITQYALGNAEWLKDNRDLSSAQIAAWQMILNTATDRKTVEIIAQEVDKLGFKIQASAEGNGIIVPK